MLDAQIPLDEKERLAALQRYCVLDTPAEPAFDRLTHVVQHVLGVPTVLVSLVDSDRQWFKSRVGLGATETPRNISFCGHAVYLREPLVVPDATQDPRFADNPLVTGPLGLRFYAGTPLITADGHALGTLCAIDYKPRSAPTPAEMDVLAKLAEAVVAALELRLYAQMQAERARLSDVQGRVAEAAHGAHTLGEALDKILPDLAISLGFDVAHACCTCGDDSDVLRSSGAWFAAPGLDIARWRAMTDMPQRISEGLTLPARVALDGKPVWVPDLTVATGEREHVACELGMGVACLFPFYAGGQVSGVVELYRRSDLGLTPASDWAGAASYIAAQLGHVADRERVERLKDEFVTTVSHELRTPLTSIAGALELLEDGRGGELPDKAARMVQVAHRNSLRLTRLVNDILDIGKIESGRLTMEIEPQPLLPLIERAMAETEAFAQTMSVHFNLDAKEPAAMARVDGDRFIQVITNLLSNASKYTPAGQAVEVSLTPHGEAWRLSVLDHGPGIPVHFRSRVFEKFAQASGADNRRCVGTGLGLAIVQKIVGLFGGAVSFDTELNVGTVFHVDLPKWQPAA